jgi:hypothetical protein
MCISRLTVQRKRTKASGQMKTSKMAQVQQIPRLACKGAGVKNLVKNLISMTKT